MPVLDLIAWSLLVVWAALLAGGFLFRSSPTSKPPVPAWIQATCSGILLLLAWYGYLLTRAGTDSARYALGIAGGMTVGLVGCLLMTGAVGPRRTLIGFSASALGYLLFIGAMARYGAALESVRWLVLSLWLVAGALAGGIVLTRARRPDPLRASAAVAYTLLLTATAGFATGLALLEPLFGVLAAGALLVLLSELPMVAELFVCPSPNAQKPGVGDGQRGWRLSWIGSAARLLRAPGHALIVVSIWSALQDFA